MGWKLERYCLGSLPAPWSRGLVLPPPEAIENADSWFVTASDSQIWSVWSLEGLSKVNFTLVYLTSVR